MSSGIDHYYTTVVLPCKAFNLWSYMSLRGPMHWDFDKIREELARIEAAVQAAKAVSA